MCFKSLMSLWWNSEVGIWLSHSFHLRSVLCIWTSLCLSVIIKILVTKFYVDECNYGNFRGANFLWCQVPTPLMGITTKQDIPKHVVIQSLHFIWVCTSLQCPCYECICPWLNFSPFETDTCCLKFFQNSMVCQKFQSVSYSYNICDINSYN